MSRLYEKSSPFGYDDIRPSSGIGRPGWFANHTDSRQRPSGQVAAAARQLLTRRWWQRERFNFELVTSQYVLDEAADGDPRLAQDRLDSLDGISLLQLGPEIDAIASEIMSLAILPPKAQVDALVETSMPLQRPRDEGRSSRSDTPSLTQTGRTKRSIKREFSFKLRRS